VSFLQAVVLGVVQGLTEFLPISSTAHLRIVPAFLGWEDPGAAYTAIVQLGTMAAVVLYFRHEIVRILVAWARSFRDAGVRRTLDARLGWIILVGTIPIGLAGVAFKDQIENGARSLYLIGTMLIVLGLLLLVAEKIGSRTRKVESITMRDGVAIGVAQAAALIPGVSRSGATITAGLFAGFDREAAARFSFLLSIPAVVLSGLFELVSISGDDTANNPGATALIVSTAVAFVVGYASIAFLLRYLAHHSTMVFVVYRVALGVLVLALAASNVIS
jgi:undecaprenyl-diphosphatase